MVELEFLEAGGKDKSEDLLTVGQVAGLLKVDDSTVRRWIKEGSLKALILPRKKGTTRRHYRIRKSELQTALSSEE